MALVFIIVLAFTADYTLGARCTEGQHCSDCDLKGGCLQDCDKGYFGMKCKSLCSNTCRYSTCELDPGKGAGRCTAGCVPGYQGIFCNRPCDSHVVSCTLCPGGCDGEYCQLGDACFTGCRDSRYGSGCKTCPSNCRTCNRMTGGCDECDPGHYGENCEKTCENCEKTCENCAGACESGCECVPGFYGDFCAETCSKRCRPKSGQKCLPAVTSDSCSGECDKHSAVCLHGCVEGWFGSMCSTPCNPGCRHQRCNEPGSCVEGCQLHHFGSDCEPCPENCANRTCDSKNGSCVGGCRDGFYGEHCNETCTLCAHGVCDQTTGACVTDCSEEGSESNCTQTCSTPGCSTGYSNSTHAEWSYISTTTLTIVPSGVVLFLLVASSVCCFCFRKRTFAQRSAQAEAGTHNNVSEEADPNYVDYEEFQKYWEIRENAAKLADGIPHQNHDSSSDVSDDALPVLADYFPGDVNVVADESDIVAGDVNVVADDSDIVAGDVNIVAGVGDNVGGVGDNEAGVEDIVAGTTGSSVSEDNYYTHLTRKVPVADERTVALYISALED